MLRQIRQDLIYALRIFRKSPGFTALVILTLALGIGANTAVFSIVDAVLLRPLPFKDPARLVAVWDRSIRERSLAIAFSSYEDFEEYAAHARSFEQLAGLTWSVRRQILTGRGPARQILAIPTTVSFFSMLGAHAERGRTFLSEDLDRGCSLVLANGFWRDELGANPNIVGQSLTLDSQPCTVLGIMPAAFAFYPATAKLWTLLTPDLAEKLKRPGMGIFGRLRPGVSFAQAESELARLHANLNQASVLQRDLAPSVYPLQDNLRFLAARNLRTTVLVLFGAVALVLLIACLNVANLLLGRAIAREREFGIRAALGSSPGRLIAQLLVEGLLLASSGALVGVVVAFGAVHYLTVSHPVELPAGARVALSLPVLAFTAGLAILTALLFALAPAWKACSIDINDSLRAVARGSTSSRGAQRIARVLVMCEMTLSLVLLAGAGLLIESILNMERAPLGFRPNGVFAATLMLPANSYAAPARRSQFYGELSRRVSALPGIEGAAIASMLPPYGGGVFAIEIQGRPVPPRSAIHDVGSLIVTPDYFRVLAVPLRFGRNFDTRDRLESEPVALINEALTREYFHGANPIGQHIRFRRDNGSYPWVTVVGVVANEKRVDLLQEMKWLERPIVFRPLAQDPPLNAMIAVRTSNGLDSLAGDVQRQVTALDANVPAYNTETLWSRLGEVLSYPRFRAVLTAAFAAFALLLAVIGLHGVLAQFVALRKQEIGVRMAMGAETGHVIRLVLIQGGLPVMSGLVLGLILALALGRYLSSLLYGVRPADPVTLAGVSLTLLAAAAIAIVVPARRAARVDPMLTLRTE